jgi:uncharacterized protein YecE (DUF72 family)
MALYVGTSGWAYKQWKPGFYPEGLPQARFLEHYSTALNSCEINATFYRRQAESTFEKWARAVGDEFRFTTKAHRFTLMPARWRWTTSAPRSSRTSSPR